MRAAFYPALGLVALFAISGCQLANDVLLGRERLHVPTPGRAAALRHGES